MNHNKELSCFRAEVMEKQMQLRTKAMREKDEIREIRKYKFALIRIRFPDGLYLQVQKITPPWIHFLLVPLNNFRARSQCMKNSPRFSSWSKKIWSTPRRRLPCYPRPATSSNRPTKRKRCLICDWCRLRFSHFTGKKRCQTTWPALFWSQKLWCLLGHSSKSLFYLFLLQKLLDNKVFAGNNFIFIYHATNVCVIHFTRV